MGVHVPLPDLRRRRDARSSCCPANTTIELHVTSLDAIHSFWAYELGVKADANPGVDNVAYVEPTKARRRSQSTAPSSAASGTATCSTPATSSRAPQFAAWIEAAAAATSRRSTKYLPAYAHARTSPTRRGEPDERLAVAGRPLWRRLIGFNLLTGDRARRRRLLPRLVRSATRSRAEPRLLRRHRPERHLASSSRYIFGVVGFLIGLGFANYPFARLRGYPPSLREKETQGIGRYFGLCTDHKVVGIQYLVGIGALLLHRRPERDADPHRAAAARQPGLPGRQQYLTLVGMHGTMMMGMMTSGILGPFANYFVPIMIGARRMAFPRIEALTFWLLMAAGAILTTTIFFGGFPTGWTGYAAAQRPGERGHGLLHRLLRARRHLDVRCSA